MAFYHRVGKIPRKRHVQFRNNKGGLYAEELVGTEGFAGNSSLVYHLHPPTMVKETGEPYSVEPKIAITKNLKNLSFKGFDVIPQNDYLDSRKTLFVNNDMHIGLAAPGESMKDWFFKNADADELIFVHKGSGCLKTIYGSIDFEYGDYLVIPRGTIYQLKFESKDNRLLYVESFSPIATPKKYHNQFGQLLEHSPFCERDIKIPHSLET